MINYDQLDEDPIVAEVRRAREELISRYGFSLRAAMEASMLRQANDPDRYVSPAPQNSVIVGDEPKKKAG